MDRLFGALILSVTLLTTAIISIILSEGAFMISVTCIGISFLIGILLLLNGVPESILNKKESTEGIEGRLQDSNRK